MTDGEFLEQLAHRIGLVTAWARAEGRELVWPAASVTARRVELEAPQAPDRKASREAGYTGNLCAVCSHPTRPSGGCEVCDNCGATSSCG